MYFIFFFFFQAEDGIRDGRVTGVQTCALPISNPTNHPWSGPPVFCAVPVLPARTACSPVEVVPVSAEAAAVPPCSATALSRSEERRVGKECRSRWSAYP